MKQKLKQYLEDNFQSVDQLKDLSKNLRTVSFVVDGAVLPDSQNDIDLQLARKMMANVLTAAVCKNDGEIESVRFAYDKEKLIEPMKYKKPKSTKEVIEDLQILYRNQSMKENPQAELLSNAIDFLKSKEDRKEAYQDKEQALNRAFRFGRKGIVEIQSHSYGPFEVPPIFFAQSTVSKCKFALQMVDRFERYIKTNFEDEGIYIDSVAEICNELRAKINEVLKREEAKAGLGFPSGIFVMAGAIGNAMAFCQTMKKGSSVSSCGEEVIRGLAHPAEFYFTQSEFEKFQNGRVESMRKIKKIIEEKKEKLSKIEIDLSQPIKEIKRFNKHLNKSIQLQSGIPSELHSNGMGKYEDADKQKKRYPQTTEQVEIDVKKLEEIKIEAKKFKRAVDESGQNKCDPFETHNAFMKIIPQIGALADITQRNIQSNGNI